MHENVAESDFDLAPDVPMLPADQHDVPSEAARQEPASGIDIPRREMGFEFTDALQTFAQAIRDRVDGERSLFENYGPAVDPWWGACLETNDRKPNRIKLFRDIDGRRITSSAC